MFSSRETNADAMFSHGNLFVKYHYRRYLLRKSISVYVACHVQSKYCNKCNSAKHSLLSVNVSILNLGPRRYKKN